MNFIGNYFRRSLIIVKEYDWPMFGRTLQLICKSFYYMKIMNRIYEIVSSRTYITSWATGDPGSSA